MAKKKLMSPKGVASYPHLNRPDTKFDDRGVYKVDLIVPAAQAEGFIAELKQLAIDEFGKRAAQAHIPVDVYAEDETKVVLKFRGQYKPVVRNAKNNILTGEAIPSIGGGSVLRCACQAGTYNAGGKIGVKLYLSQVQLIEVQSYDDCPFPEEEEGYVGDPSPFPEEDEGGAEEPVSIPAGGHGF